MDVCCDALLTNLSRQHQAFLDEAKGSLLRMYREENRRLQEELEAMRGDLVTPTRDAGRVRTPKAPPPPLPPVPISLPALPPIPADTEPAALEGGGELTHPFQPLHSGDDYVLNGGRRAPGLRSLASPAQRDLLDKPASFVPQRESADKVQRELLDKPPSDPLQILEKPASIAFQVQRELQEKPAVTPFQFPRELQEKPIANPLQLPWEVLDKAVKTQQRVVPQSLDAVPAPSPVAMDVDHSATHKTSTSDEDDDEDDVDASAGVHASRPQQSHFQADPSETASVWSKFRGNNLRKILGLPRSKSREWGRSRMVSWRSSWMGSEDEENFSVGDKSMSAADVGKQRSFVHKKMSLTTTVEDRYRQRQHRRLLHVLGFSNERQYVSAVTLVKVMARRCKFAEEEFTTEEATDVINEFNRILRKPTNAEDLPIIGFNAFLDLLLREDLLEVATRGMRRLVGKVQRNLLSETVDEVLDEVTLIEAPKALQNLLITPVDKKAIWEMHINWISSATVVVSMFCMAVSMDIDPDNTAWMYLEMAFCIVFVLEFLYKICAYGLGSYFAGENWQWNWLDFAITVLSVGDVTASFIQDHMNQKVAGADLFTLLRTLRVARLIRLTKLLNSPLLKDLANMLGGILVGMTALLWVMVLLGLVIFSFGLCFRVAFGPTPGQNLMAKCGLPDDYEGDDPQCKIHWMYGEEFFGNVPRSMLTAFRFMIGDYSSKKGVNLTVSLSDGYGPLFDLAFTVWMVLIIFGLFNVVTAIFVDSTIAGLKHNDVKRKHARMYEHTFVRTTLEKLVRRINDIQNWKEDSLFASEACPEIECAESFKLDEEQFYAVMRDPEVRNLLKDLDVNMYNPAGMFDTFDPKGTGGVSLLELATAVMKLRGEPQKNDVIASWLALKALQDKVERLEAVMCARLQGGDDGKAVANGFRRPAAS